MKDVISYRTHARLLPRNSARLKVTAAVMTTQAVGIALVQTSSQINVNTGIATATRIAPSQIPMLRLCLKTQVDHLVLLQDASKLISRRLLNTHL